MSTEVWAAVPDYPGYWVSDLGRVRSADRIDRRRRVWPGHALRPHVKRSGHLSVELSKNSGTITRYVHRLVASAFIPNPDDYPLVRHLDGVPANNAVANLAWGTYAQNTADAQRHGTMPIAGKKKETA